MNRAPTAAIALLAMLISLQVSAKKEPPPPQFVVVRKLAPEAVIQRIQLACTQGGMSIVQVTANQVTCSKPMDGSMKSLFFRALATPSYSTNPVYYYRVNAIRVGDSTTISAEQFMQYQNAYGQETTLPITNRNDLNLTAQGLQNIKTSWEARLAAAGDDEAAALAASNAALSSAGGVIANLQAPASSSSAIQTGQANNHPSAPMAKQTLSQFQCSDAFRLVGESDGKALFEAKCTGGGTQLVQCFGMVCKPLH